VRRREELRPEVDEPKSVVLLQSDRDGDREEDGDAKDDG
jgi:hypothetical protein